jgi:hypothetical protein
MEAISDIGARKSGPMPYPTTKSDRVKVATSSETPKYWLMSWNAYATMAEPA